MLLNKITFYNELKKNGFDENEQYVFRKIKLVLDNLKKIELIFKNLNIEKNTFNQNFDFLPNQETYRKKYILLKNNFFYKCNNRLLNCNEYKKLGQDLDFEKKLLSGDFKDENNLFYFSKFIDNQQLERKFIENKDFSLIYIGNFLDLMIDEKNKKINILTIDPDAQIIFKSNSEINDWKIFAKFSNSTYNNRISKSGLTGCVTFLDTKVKNIDITLNNCPQEDGINFIRTKGFIKSLNVKDTSHDGVDFVF
jgi:hypothetical protein